MARSLLRTSSGLESQNLPSVAILGCPIAAIGHRVSGQICQSIRADDFEKGQ